MTKTIRAALAGLAITAAMAVAGIGADVYHDMNNPQPTAAAVTVHTDSPDPDVYHDM